MIPAAQHITSRKQGAWRAEDSRGRTGTRLLPSLVSNRAEPKQTSRVAHLQRWNGAQRCHFADYRFSEDLDFTLTRRVEFAEICQGLEEIYQFVAQASGMRFTFEAEDRQTHVNSYSFYLRYQGPLPISNTVKVDVTLSEVVLFPVEELPVLRSYPEFEDVSEGHLVPIYSLNEIATEEIVALQDRARNEPRDLYDLWFLVSHAGVEMEHLVSAVIDKLRFREKESAGVEGRIASKEARLRALWNSRLGHQMEVLP